MRKKLVLFLGAVTAGFLNGLLGTGGVIIAVSVFKHAGMQQRQAQACTTVFILVMCAVSLAALSGAGQQWDISSAIWISVGGIPGAILGARLLHKLKNDILQIVFAVLILISGIRMIF